jgi:hypothetical protein
MLSLLREVLMSDEMPNPTMSKWGYVVLDYIGLGFILVGPEEFVRTDQWKMPLVYVAVGAAFLFLGIMGPRIKTKVLGNTQLSKITVAMVALMIATCLAVGFDYFDRHPIIGSVSESPLIAPMNDDLLKVRRQLMYITARWNGYPLQNIVDTNFNGGTVLLDGRKFSNCTFSNVTFVYEGTAPFEFNPTTPIITGSWHLETGQPIVKAVFNLMIGVRAIPGAENKHIQ